MSILPDKVLITREDSQVSRPSQKMSILPDKVLITREDYLSSLSDSFESFFNFVLGNFENDLNSTLVGTVRKYGQSSDLQHPIFSSFILEIVAHPFHIPVVIFGVDIERLTTKIQNGHVVQITPFVAARSSSLKFRVYIVCVESTTITTMEIVDLPVITSRTKIRFKNSELSERSLPLNSFIQARPLSKHIGVVTDVIQCAYWRFGVFPSFTIEVCTNDLHIPALLSGRDMNHFTRYKIEPQKFQMSSFMFNNNWRSQSGFEIISLVPSSFTSLIGNNPTQQYILVHIFQQVKYPRLKFNNVLVYLAPRNNN
ncbi:hypothetical protein QAD02_009551 [Eretmocerus hayati]|uniref:Uncharacterized protein n=1 Tax=Eretmocerus hayati TaxID=131215 RepID=A0ACC2NAC7_9HYME|nr:hypothetical protein QAD02_009551 [Eretmocerus hayati]